MKSVKQMVAWSSLLVLAGSSVGCATSFTGSAHVENGRGGCEAKCKGQGMDFVGMVYMGEYSDACICASPNETASNRQLLLSAGASAAASGSVGVVTAQRQRNSSQSNTYRSY